MSPDDLAVTQFFGQRGMTCTILIEGVPQQVVLAPWPLDLYKAAWTWLFEESRTMCGHLPCRGQLLTVDGIQYFLLEWLGADRPIAAAHAPVLVAPNPPN